jgi:hypothetical protein
VPRLAVRGLEQAGIDADARVADVDGDDGTLLLGSTAR